MALPYYTHASGSPADQTRALAAVIRDELDLIAQSFNLLPVPSALVAGLQNYAVDTGTANAYVATLSPLLIAYSDGLTLRIKATNANTGTATLNVNGIGIRSIVRPDGTSLAANDIWPGQIIQVSYNATTSQFQLQLTPLAAVYQALGFATAAAGSASTASGAASTAVTAAGQATTARDQVLPARDQTLIARDEAVAAAATAGAPLVATSTTSLTVGITTQNLDVGIGKGFAPGQTVTIARTSAPATVWMRGTVLSYSSTGAGPLSVAVAEVAGSGTFADWSISVAGNRGASSLTLPVVGVSANTTGAANVFYRLDAAVALTMPASPADGDFFAFANRSGGVPTINPNGKKIKGDSSILSLDTLNASACLKYDAANGDWVESFAGYTVASVSSNAILLQPNTWSAKQTFTGGVALGGVGAPTIRQRLYTGTTAAVQGGSVTIPLAGLDYSKILNISAIVNDGSNQINEANSVIPGYQFASYAFASGLVVQNHATNSANILSKPVTLLISYTD